MVGAFCFYESNSWTRWVGPRAMASEASGVGIESLWAHYSRLIQRNLAWECAGLLLR